MVSSDTVRISTEEADRLTAIITDAIDKAVKPNGLGRLVFDGTTYFFMLPDKMAKTCSPEKNTNCYKLVEEFENLKKLFGDQPFLELSSIGNTQRTVLFATRTVPAALDFLSRIPGHNCSPAVLAAIHPVAHISSKYGIILPLFPCFSGHTCKKSPIHAILSASTAILKVPGYCVFINKSYLRYLML